MSPTPAPMATNELSSRLEGVSISSTSRHSFVGAGVRLAAASVDMSQGKLRHTDRPLDLAIEGEGFFQLEDRRTKQIFYTRCGRFAVNAQGELVWRAARGNCTCGPAVKIGGPESDVEIAADGTVVAHTLLHDSPTKGRDPHQRIEIVRVPALADLTPTGENLFAVRSEIPFGVGSASDALSGRVRQGCLGRIQCRRRSRTAGAGTIASPSAGGGSRGPKPVVQFAGPVQSSD